MDQVLMSNNTSVILRSLQDQPTTDLSYSTKKAFPILASDYRSIQPVNTTGVTHGGEIAFNITKANLWRDAVIQSTYTFSGNHTALLSDTKAYGLQLFEKIEVRSNNKVLFTFSDYALKGVVQSYPVEKAELIWRMALPLLTTTYAPAPLGSNTTVTSFTHIPCAFFESVKNHIDLNFYEQLQVVVKLNTQARMGAEVDITSCTAVLWNYRYQLDAKAYDALRSKNQNPSRPLNMFTLNTFTEFVECTGANTNSIRLNVNYPVVNMYIMLMNKTTGAALGGEGKLIDTFDFELNGVKLLENVPNVVAWYLPAKHGSSADIVTSSTDITLKSNKCICLNFGLDPMDKTYMSGALSMSQINFPQVTIRHQTITPADYNLVVVSEYSQILSLDSSNGSVQISANS